MMFMMTGLLVLILQTPSIHQQFSLGTKILQAVLHGQKKKVLLIGIPDGHNFKPSIIFEDLVNITDIIFFFSEMFFVYHLYPWYLLDACLYYCELLRFCSSEAERGLKTGEN